MSFMFGHTDGPIEPAHNARRTCKPPTEEQLVEAGQYASERPACNGCPAGCGGVVGRVELDLQNRIATINDEPVKFEDGVAVMRQLNGEAPTRLDMLREMLAEANADLEKALQNQEPQGVYLHGEAVAACEELIAYFSK